MIKRLFSYYIGKKYKHSNIEVFGSRKYDVLCNDKEKCTYLKNSSQGLIQVFPESVAEWVQLYTADGDMIFDTDILIDNIGTLYTVEYNSKDSSVVLHSFAYMKENNQQTLRDFGDKSAEDLIDNENTLLNFRKFNYSYLRSLS